MIEIFKFLYVQNKHKDMNYQDRKAIVNDV